MRRFVLTGAALVLGLTGCGGAAAARPASSAAVARTAGTSSTQTITVDGKERTYRVHRPASVTGPDEVPLVVMIHGGFGSAAQAEKSYGWDESADREGFVVAYPDGDGKAWNVGAGCCGRPGRSGVDDVGFITAMVHRISASLPIDTARIYATGISNGGMMDYRLACDTDLFAGIGPDSATLMGTCPGPARTSVIHVHGLSDVNVPFDGSPGHGIAKVDGPPVPAVIATWRRVDGCAPPRVTTAGDVTTSTARCPDGRDVELITIAGAGHGWPGGSGRYLGKQPSDALDATSTIWRFLSAHHR